YDTLNATRRIVSSGLKPSGVRLDSGDLDVTSRAVRRILDDGGLTATRIFGSGDLDEWRIEELVGNGAPIDAFGVGGALSTSSDGRARGLHFLNRVGGVSGADVDARHRIVEDGDRNAGMARVEHRPEDAIVGRDAGDEEAVDMAFVKVGNQRASVGGMAVERRVTGLIVVVALADDDGVGGQLQVRMKLGAGRILDAVRRPLAAI